VNKTERRRQARQRQAAKATRRGLIGEEITAERDRKFVPLKRVQRDDRPNTTLIPGAAAQNWISVPPRNRGVIAESQQAWRSPSRLTFGESVVAGFDPTTQRGAMVKSQALRPPVIRGFTGQRIKDEALAEATDRQAQAMRDASEVFWDAHHATMVSGSATRDGRPAFRPERTSLRSTEKLGDMKAS
jgi:hypothetical protein